MRTALLVERHKAAASIVFGWATALLVLGILTMAASMTLAATAGNEQVRAKVGPLADTHGWDQLIGIVSMISAPAALLGFGSCSAGWLVASSPTRRMPDCSPSRSPGGDIAMAKLGVFLGWASGVALFLTLGSAVTGIALGYGVPNGDEAAARCPGSPPRS